MSVDVVTCTAHVTSSVTAAIQHLCPFKDEVDKGTAVITWLTSDGRTIELHSLRSWLETFANVRISHEDLTGHLLDAIVATGLPGVTVETRWRTAGMEVVCVSSQTPAETRQ